jgi:hypothetical protein
LLHVNTKRYSTDVEQLFIRNIKSETRSETMKKAVKDPVKAVKGYAKGGPIGKFKPCSGCKNAAACAKAGKCMKGG